MLFPSCVDIYLGKILVFIVYANYLHVVHTSEVYLELKVSETGFFISI